MLMQLRLNFVLSAAPWCWQHPANALVHRPVLLEYVMSEKIKVCTESSDDRCSLNSINAGSNHRCSLATRATDAACSGVGTLKQHGKQQQCKHCKQQQRPGLQAAASSLQSG